MSQKIDNRATGFTMVELLVSLALSSLIIAMIAGLFIFMNENFIGFQNRSNFNDHRLLLESIIRRHLRGIDEIVEANDDEIKYRTFKEFTYTIRKSGINRIFLNEEEILPSGFETANFDFRYYHVLNRGNGSEVEEVRDLNGNFIIDGDELQSIDLVKLEFQLKYKKIVREIEITHFLRSKY